MAGLKNQITEDMKSAMRARDSERLGALRLLLAAIKQKEVDERVDVDDVAVLSILEKMLKQRRDSIDQYTKANRMDLVEQEAFEVTVLEKYLPAPLTETEINDLVKQAVAESQASVMSDMGKVMAILRPTVSGRADMAKISQLVKQVLGTH
ncbi:MAG: glutamyl-tRNA amidotransferase [Ferrovum sp. 37-45-19]|uniref:GatB/YqeY domain-containing protein n=1 Tax=Ferrovum sp. JA12 TaxID=1356299 RepID=UPI000716324F|nr:GatB/YqeY domain-containing protein [Ferrovum sp. JA12]OYV80767.1 MAG: glutamyl-tRNA amidotransferase [Ferrovum sp. 21-44-67]OYV95322.1 MAG: glutamyl-tRNA amidotransferase [Ferrovum sp. 37-45-19]OZB33807.1 MAG: glutamyl-tRNA amidotransferase [Ferrovum sp. 34-44-207]HQT80792.1 GatB/YqeY domain-containing protein [Ferrovaceae bacterium]KRH79887.1 yqey-like protein [Ferrovum sp. JA12]